MANPEAEKVVIRKGLDFKRFHFYEGERRIFTFSEVLKRDGDFFGLLSSPLEARRFESPHFTIYSAAYTDNLFYGNRFVNFLNCSVPREAFAGIYEGEWTRLAILSDWEEIQEMENLFGSHKRDLDPHWTEFMNQHMKLFARAMREVHPEEIESSLEIEKDYLFRKDFAIYKIKQLGLEKERSDYSVVSAEQILETLRSVPSEMHRELSHDKMFSKIFFGSKTIRIIDTHEKAHEEKRLYDQSTDEYIDDRVYPGAQYLGDDVVKIEYDRSWMLVRLTKDGERVELERHIEGRDENGLLPWFLWAKVKKTGERFYVSSRAPQWLKDQVDHRADEYLGLVVATSLEPQGHIPIKGKLSGEEGTQNMLEAQYPLLASLERKHTLNGPVITRLEKAIESNMLQ